MNKIKIKNYVQEILFSLEYTTDYLFNKFNQSPFLDLLYKHDAEACLRVGAYSKNERLVNYAITHYPKTIQKLDFVNVSLTTPNIAQILINSGYDPFPAKYSLTTFKKQPYLLKMFLNKGMSFEHLFSEIVDKNEDKQQTTYSNSVSLLDVFLRYNNYIFQIEPKSEFLSSILNLDNDKEDLATQEKKAIEFVEVLLENNFFISEFYKNIRSTVEYYAKAIMGNTISFEFLNYIEGQQQKKLLETEPSLNNNLGKLKLL